MGRMVKRNAQEKRTLILMPIPELLMPAGDFEKMQYAFAFGADAVYLGIPRFSLRARENGFRNLLEKKEIIQLNRNILKF